MVVRRRSGTAGSSLGGGLTFSPDAVSYGPGEFDVYVRGQDGALWQTWQSGGAWRGWAPIGGILTSSPGAATLGQGRVDVFVRGADGALWHTAWDSGAGWYGWDIGAGLLNSAPDAVWRGPNWLDVFMRGVDGQIWQMTWDGVSWIGPYVLAWFNAGSRPPPADRRGRSSGRRCGHAPNRTSRRVR